MRSILAQTRQADEIIVVDDGSTDDTARILQEFRDQHNLTVVTLTTNRGVSVAANKGLRECHGKWVARVDADDWWDENHLETLERLLQTSHSNVSLVATRARYWNDKGYQIGESHEPLNAGALRCFMMRDNPFVHSAVMFRLEAARHVGSYPISVRWEDYGLWIALMRKNDALILDTVTVNCRKGKGSLSAVDKLTALQGRLEMQLVAWRQFRRSCPINGTAQLVTTWFRLFIASAMRRPPGSSVSRRMHSDSID